MIAAMNQSQSTADPFRWGVLGARSGIYHKSLRPAFERSGRHVIVAEASRDGSGGEAPYAAMLGRDDVEAVYIPLPNVGHKPWILRALAAGKHVLCEKPLTLTPADTVEVFAAADAAGRVLLEAYMWPHHARARRTLELCADGSIGELRSTRSIFTFPFDRPSDHRLDERGAGALFDVGIYCLGPAMLLADRDPVRAAASAVRNAAGVDVSMTGWVDWGEGFTSTFEVSFDQPGRRTLEVAGTREVLTIPDWHAPGPVGDAELMRTDRTGTVTTEVLAGSDAYEGMVDQFVQVVRAEAAPVFGPADSRRLAAVIDMVQLAAATPV
jgi:D-xylose 1-dehydrogenase (NADP+, D-xylono-1,5-lactone-forming)